MFDFPNFTYPQFVHNDISFFAKENRNLQIALLLKVTLAEN